MFYDMFELLMAFSIPLTAIGGAVFLISKRMSMKHLSVEERKVLLDIKAENAELRRRLEAIETIVTDTDSDMAKIAQTRPAAGLPSHTEQMAQKVEALRQQIERRE